MKEISVNKNEVSDISLEFEEIKSLKIQYNGRTGPISVLDTELSPKPSYVLESFPPIWKWDDSTDVEVTLHIDANESGSYEYSINSDKSSKEVVIEVE